MSVLVLGAALFLLADPTPQDANRASDSSQRGSRVSSGGGEDRSGPPAPGIESGDASGPAGGRTDEGPRGTTGTGGVEGVRHEHELARRNSQARGRNRKGSFHRPADTPPRINRDPKPMGSGAPMTLVADEPQPQGRNYPAGPQPGAAGKAAGPEKDEKK